MSSISSNPSAKAPAVDMADMKKKSVHGGMITMLSQGVSIAFQLASTVILARLLSPDDYGIIAMVMAITGFAGLFRDLGLSAAAIQKDTLSHAQMSNLFWLNIGMGGGLTIALAVAAPLVANFYNNEELVPLTQLLSTSFIINSFGTLHGALMQRDLQFGRKAICSIVGFLVMLAVSVVLAWLGKAYWALAWGTIAGAIVTSILFFAFSSFRPGLWTRGAGVRPMLKFGANITAFDFVNYFHRNLDNILIGRVWGVDALGFYSRAYSLLMLPINSLRGPLNTVGFPALSRLQEEPSAYRSYFYQLTNVLALASMPLTAFLFIGAAPIVHLVLGTQWDGIVPIFSILAAAAFVQPVITLWGMICLSRGMGKRYLCLGIFNTICSAIGFICGLPWGALGVAAGYAIATYLTAYPILVWAFRDTPLCFADFLKAIIRPLSASLITALPAYLIASALSNVPPIFSLLPTGAAFGGVYLVVLRLLPGGQKEIANIMKAMQFVVTIGGLKTRMRIAL